jgi:hypothetical protein
VVIALPYTAKKTSQIPKFTVIDFIFWKKQVYIVDGILNGIIECPAQLLDDNNAPKLNED